MGKKNGNKDEIIRKEEVCRVGVMECKEEKQG